jgi:hypothetical protein
MPRLNLDFMDRGGRQIDLPSRGTGRRPSPQQARQAKQQSQGAQMAQRAKRKGQERAVTAMTRGLGY